MFADQAFQFLNSAEKHVRRQLFEGADFLGGVGSSECGASESHYLRKCPLNQTFNLADRHGRLEKLSCWRRAAPERVCFHTCNRHLGVGRRARRNSGDLWSSPFSEHEATTVLPMRESCEVMLKVQRALLQWAPGFGSGGHGRVPKRSKEKEKTVMDVFRQAAPPEGGKLWVPYAGALHRICPHRKTQNFLTGHKPLENSQAKQTVDDSAFPSEHGISGPESRKGNCLK